MGVRYYRKSLDEGKSELMILDENYIETVYVIRNCLVVKKKEYLDITKYEYVEKYRKCNEKFTNEHYIVNLKTIYDNKFTRKNTADDIIYCIAENKGDFEEYNEYNAEFDDEIRIEDLWEFFDVVKNGHQYECKEVRYTEDVYDDEYGDEDEYDVWDIMLYRDTEIHGDNEWEDITEIINDSDILDTKDTLKGAYTLLMLRDGKKILVSCTELRKTICEVQNELVKDIDYAIESVYYEAGQSKVTRYKMSPEDIKRKYG